jgi:arabinogalactan oligomer/maltooligosaccharide transport system permease protein
MTVKAYQVKKVLGTLMVYLDLVIVTVIVVYPLLWVLSTSFNNRAGVTGSLFPAAPTFDNYIRLFTKTKYGAWYLNTLIVAVITTIFSIVLHTMTAFVFARFRFRGRKTGLLFVMILQLFPSFMGLTALYMVALNFGMLNNLIMLVIIYVAGGIPQNIWLVRGFMLNIPRSLDEAAFIDGTSKVQLFFHVILPLSLPIITFISVTSFMGPWMDYMLPRYLINQNEKRTLAIGLFDMIAGTNSDVTAFCAGSVLVAVPITFLYMIFQKFLLEGLMAGANKGE